MTYLIDVYDAQIKRWIQTPQDNSLWCTYVQPALRQVASATVQRHGRDYDTWGHTFESCVDVLVSQCGLALLRYRPNRKASIKTYLYRIMKNYIAARLFAHHKRHKRNAVNVVHLDAYDIDLQDVVLADSSTVPAYDYIKDPEFIQFYVAWWKKYGRTYFTRSTLPMVETILDMVVNPERYPLHSNNYTRVICQRFRVTRQRVQQVMKKMREQRQRIINAFEGGGIATLLLG